jgi:hypothetical protein
MPKTHFFGVELNVFFALRHLNATSRSFIKLLTLLVLTTMSST